MDQAADSPALAVARAGYAERNRLMRSTYFACLSAIVLSLAGCASYPVVGDGTTARNRVFGSFGLTGHGNHYTVENGSRLSYLKVAGDNNVVTVEDGAFVYKVEFWGRNNTVSLPYGLKPRVAQAGNNNQIVYRPMPSAAPLRFEPLEGMESTEPNDEATPETGSEESASP